MAIFSPPSTTSRLHHLLSNLPNLFLSTQPFNLNGSFSSKSSGLCPFPQLHLHWHHHWPLPRTLTIQSLCCMIFSTAHQLQSLMPPKRNAIDTLHGGHQIFLLSSRTAGQPTPQQRNAKHHTSFSLKYAKPNVLTTHLSLKNPDLEKCGSLPPGQMVHGGNLNHLFWWTVSLSQTFPPLLKPFTQLSLPTHTLLFFLHYPMTPPALPPRHLSSFTSAFLQYLLSSTSNTSAPGASFINYRLIKWAFPLISTFLTSLFNACVQLHHFPLLWRKATIICIPKPNKTNYTLPRSYRPISLLECFGKLLEKALAHHIQLDLLHYPILHPLQFGCRRFSSTIDAGLYALHFIHSHLAISTSTVVSMLTLDIKGFLTTSITTVSFIFFTFMVSQLIWYLPFNLFFLNVQHPSESITQPPLPFLSLRWASPKAPHLAPFSLPFLHHICLLL